MTTAEVREAWHTGNYWTPEFDSAIDGFEAELPTCDNARLAELLELAADIDCYYGYQCSFLTEAAQEAARRLRGPC